MARTYTVSELATKIRIRGDYENSDFITDAILIDFIDSAHTEVYDLLVTKWEDYYTLEATFNTSDGEAAYTLPSDFYKLMGVDVNHGGIWNRLFRYNLHERNTYQDGLYSYRGNIYLYRLQGDTVKFIPTPTTIENMRMLYIPSAAKLTALADTIDGINGWEELVVLFALRRCQVREETSTSAVDKEIDRQVKRLEISADARDAGEPESLQDMSYSDFDYNGFV